MLLSTVNNIINKIENTSIEYTEIELSKKLRTEYKLLKLAQLRDRNKTATISDKDLALFINIYLEQLAQIDEQLNEIQSNIGYCNQKLNTVLSTNQKNKFLYYKRINDEMLKRILKRKESNLKPVLVNRISNYCLLNKKGNSAFYSIASYEYETIFHDPRLDCSLISMYQLVSKEDYQNIWELKNSNLDEYMEFVEDLIIEADILKSIDKAICNNHVLQKRQHIFQTIFEFYHKKDYEILLNLLVMQIEGIFKDFIDFISMKSTESPGALPSKTDQALKTNRIFYLTHYPYFSFEFYELRNEIAHNGIANVPNIELKSKELIINCYSLLDIFKSSYLPYENLKKISNYIEKQDDGFTPVNIINSLLLWDDCLKIDNERSVYRIIKENETYKSELKFYRTNSGQDLWDITIELINIFKSSEFWDVYIDHLEQEKIGLKFIEHADQITKEMIGYLGRDTSAHQKCRKVIELLKKQT